jgi:2-keto-4-pentenoate hydratase/2-oxohepta-3-ene-1,7-dioic acid hydratase in catechol pathway
MDKIVCIGKNYLDHAAELGDKIPEKPVIFLKPSSVLRAAVQNEELELSIPEDRGELHFETEIVLRLDRGGFKLDLKDAEKCIGAVTIGLDMTLRDLQATQKKNGHPWTTSKVFPDAAVVGPWIRVSEFPNYLDEPFSFMLNEEIKHQEVGSKMRLSPAEMISYISEFFPLSAGDVIFTGTPAGVAKINLGQKGILKYGDISYSVVWNNK